MKYYFQPFIVDGKEESSGFIMRETDHPSFARSVAGPIEKVVAERICDELNGFLNGQG